MEDDYASAAESSYRSNNSCSDRSGLDSARDDCYESAAEGDDVMEGVVVVDADASSAGIMGMERAREGEALTEEMMSNDFMKSVSPNWPGLPAPRDVDLVRRSATGAVDIDDAGTLISSDVAASDGSSALNATLDVDKTVLKAEADDDDDDPSIDVLSGGGSKREDAAAPRGWPSFMTPLKALKKKSRQRSFKSDSEYTYGNKPSQSENVSEAAASRRSSLLPITDIEFTSPFRARSRIWDLVGQSLDSKDVKSRSPHRCCSRFPNRRKSDHLHHHHQPIDVEQQDGRSCDVIGGADEQPGSPNSRSRPLNVKGQYESRSTSISGLPLDKGGHDVEHIGAQNDFTSISSSDSHCHSNQKKTSMDKKARFKLILASVLCLIFMSGEMAGGILAGSLAIMSDAAHLLTDLASFMISLGALYLANRPATKKLSFGWYRAEILGALVSILMLWVLTGILVYSAVLRIMDGTYEIDATVMLITAGTGVGFNILLGTTLHQHTHSHGGGGGHGHSHGGQGHSHGGQGHGHSHGGDKGHGHSHKGQGGHDNEGFTVGIKQQLKPHRSASYGSIDVEQGHLDSSLLLRQSDSEEESSVESRHSNINVKAAFVHVIGDLLQSIGVLVAAIIIYFKPEWKIADPICTFLFSLFVLVTTMTIMRDILMVLMEGTPRGINFAEVRNTFFSVDGVLDIHNLRVWSLTMDKMALSVHLAINKQSDPHRVLKLASRAIQQKFNISETTMQIEEYVTEMDDCHDCKGPRL